MIHLQSTGSPLSYLKSKIEIKIKSIMAPTNISVMLNKVDDLSFTANVFSYDRGSCQSCGYIGISASMNPKGSISVNDSGGSPVVYNGTNWVFTNVEDGNEMVSARYARTLFPRMKYNGFSRELNEKLKTLKQGN